MTPEELAVIQAAMAYRHVVLANPHLLRRLDNAGSKLTPVLSELNRTTWKLATARGECNVGGHICPGDGNPIPHSAKDCGRHDEEVKHAGADGACPDYGSRLDPCPPGCASGTCVANDPTRCPPVVTGGDEAERHLAVLLSEHAEPELAWVARTWTDVRTGDRVRAPGSDAVAYVQNAVRLRWHVKPGTGASQYNPPQPLEWAGIRVTMANILDGHPFGVYEMDPAKPVEIEIDRDAAKTAALMCGGTEGFWRERLGFVIEEKAL